VDTTILRNAPEKSSANTRAERALRLFEERGREIERVADDTYLVPSCTGEGVYRVRYGEQERCQSADFEFHGGPCKHLMAVGLSVARRRGQTARRLDALEERLAHELMDDDERQELRDRVLRLRRRLGL
jgi:hypothetical protein